MPTLGGGTLATTVSRDVDPTHEADDGIYAGLDAVTLRRRNHHHHRRHPRRGQTDDAAALLLAAVPSTEGPTTSVPTPPRSGTSGTTGALFALKQKGRQNGVRQRHGGFSPFQPCCVPSQSATVDDDDHDDNDAVAAEGRASIFGRDRLGGGGGSDEGTPASARGGSRQPLRSLSAQNLSTSPNRSRGGGDRKETTPSHDASMTAQLSPGANTAIFAHSMTTTAWAGPSRGVPLASPVPDVSDDDSSSFARRHARGAASGPVTNGLLPPPSAADATSDDDDNGGETAEEIRRFTTAAASGGGATSALLPARVPLLGTHQATAAPSPAPILTGSSGELHGTPSMTVDTPAHSGGRVLVDDHSTSRSGTAVFDAYDEAAVERSRRDDEIIRQALGHRGPLDGSSDDDGDNSDDDDPNGNHNAASATLTRRVSTAALTRRSPSPSRTVREVAGHVSTVSDVAAANGSHTHRADKTDTSRPCPPPNENPAPMTTTAAAASRREPSHAPPEAFPKFVYKADEASVGRQRGADDAHGDKRAGKGDKPCCVVM